jgi:hypothetical protein
MSCGISTVKRDGQPREGSRGESCNIPPRHRAFPAHRSIFALDDHARARQAQAAPRSSLSHRASEAFSACAVIAAGRD